MASSVFFRFKSQKEPSRIAFDGTGISVFELKREIIAMNRLGDGTDFELIVTSEDTNEEYEDDTAIVPRSTTVIAKRLPAQKPGRGGAARYVSGKMPQNAKNSYRTETSATKTGLAGKTTGAVNGMADMSGAQTEEEKIAAMFKLGADHWAQQQQEMASATPVYRNGPIKGKPINVPDHAPPPGYVCYRCGEKGHWIQACPTNDDPAFVNRPRVKRTTGIPRSFLKTVEKPTALPSDGTLDDQKQPSGIMVNAEGEWVIAEPDKASWDQYKAKAQVSAAAQQAAAQGNRELQEKGLECSFDKRLFIEPTLTPCCHKTYCLECITNLLVDNDLRCPNCATENILIDDLKPDTQMAEQVRNYERELMTMREPNDPGVSAETNSSEGNQASQHSKTSLLNDSQRKPSPVSESQQENPLKKRPADSELVSARRPGNPAAEKAKVASTKALPSQGQHQASKSSSYNNNNNTSVSGTRTSTQATNPMTLTQTPNLMMPMSMPQPMIPIPGMYDPMMMPNAFLNTGGNHNNNNWNMWNIGYNQHQPPLGMAGPGLAGGGMMQTGNYGFQNMQVPSMNYSGLNGNGMMMPKGAFSNQQRNHFGNSNAPEEESAYFRKPVNPHRHHARRNINRPTDYREI